MAEATPKMKTGMPVKSTHHLPLGSRIYQGWVGAIGKLKSEPMDVKSPRGAAARKRDWSQGRGSVYTEIPPITDPAIQEVGFYGVAQPFSYIRATYNSSTSEFLLNVIEPELTEDEQELLTLIKDTLEKTLDYDWDKMT